MGKRKYLSRGGALGGAVIAGASVFLAMGVTPADAAGAACPTLTGGQTCAQFTINSGGLSISVPATAANLTSSGAVTLGENGATVTGQLGATTVTDTRGLGSPGWTVTAASSDYSDGAGHTIAKGQVSAYSGLPTDVTSLISALIVPTIGLLPVNLATPQTLIAAPVPLGLSNHATYNPTVNIAVPANAVAGTYFGTITQTVS
jgi:hypothetical protein